MDITFPMQLMNATQWNAINNMITFVRQSSQGQWAFVLVVRTPSLHQLMSLIAK